MDHKARPGMGMEMGVQIKKLVLFDKVFDNKSLLGKDSARSGYLQDSR